MFVGQYGVLLSSGVSSNGKNSSYNLAGGLSPGLLAWLTVMLLMVNLEAKVFFVIVVCFCLF